MRGKWWLPGLEPAYTRASATTLLLWTKTHTNLYSRLSLNIISEISDYFDSPHSLLLLDEKSMRFFDCCERQWQPSIAFRSRLDSRLKGQRVVILIDGRVLCCGGQYRKQSCARLFISKKAYLISRKGSVIILPSMISDRHSHGLIEYNQVIYVFGGSNQYLAVYKSDQTAPSYLHQCERLSRNGKWEEMPRMQEGRTEVSVCMHQGIIYVSGFGSVLIEAFSPLQLVFSPHSIALSFVSTCLITIDNTIIAYSSSTWAKLSSEQGELREVERKRCEGDRKVSECPVVLDRPAKWVFYLMDNAACAFHIESGRCEAKHGHSS